MKVFVTGATGYLGGSISHKLIEQGHEVLGLVRTAEQAAQLEQRGISALLGTLDDAGALHKGATESDATINAANSDHFFSIQTLISSLKGSGKTLIHTSGTSIVCDDAKGEFASEAILQDDTPFEPQLHRGGRVRIDQLVRSAGIHDGIRAFVICPSMVYGTGLGLRKDSDQLPKLVKQSQAVGAGVFIGKGATVWSNVYISDLADLYVQALDNAPSGAFFFAENGEATFQQIAEAVHAALGFKGETRSWPYDEAVEALGPFARVALATNARVRATNARKLLGWAPTGPDLREALIRGV
ncbi:NAD-dependent epimerase/dehydratase family protein [Pseudomonas sp. NPDC088368]|uniref:NAD-dependent epimerase/dehydratase family protein n=1 Tax=Pseudomonas sp. NPDC088368 TaxID=3364453 RepID=UPI00382AD1FC